MCLSMKATLPKIELIRALFKHQNSHLKMNVIESDVTVHLQILGDRTIERGGNENDIYNMTNMDHMTSNLSPLPTICCQISPSCNKQINDN